MKCHVGRRAQAVAVDKSEDVTGRAISDGGEKVTTEVTTARHEGEEDIRGMMARASKIQRARRLLLLRKFATPLRTQRPVASRSAAGGGSPKGHFHLQLWLSGRTDGQAS